MSENRTRGNPVGRGHAPMEREQLEIHRPHPVGSTVAVVDLILLVFSRIRCTKLLSLVLADGEYYELVRSNFERADRQRVVRTTNSDQTSIVSLLKYYNDLRFN